MAQSTPAPGGLLMHVVVVDSGGARC